MHRTGERMVTRQFRPAAGGGAPALVRLDGEKIIVEPLSS